MNNKLLTVINSRGALHNNGAAVVAAFAYGRRACPPAGRLDGPQTRCSLPRQNSILALSIHAICSFAALCGSTWTLAAMLYQTSIPSSPERTPRLIF
jgi:hypothetical protein